MSRSALFALLLALPVMAQSLPAEGFRPSLRIQESPWSLAGPGLVKVEGLTFSFAPFAEAPVPLTAAPIPLRFSNRMTFKGMALRVGAHAFLANETHEKRLNFLFDAAMGTAVPGAPGKDLRLYIGTGIAF